MGGERQNVRRICGDGLLVQLDSNDCVLEVTGDGCRITMAKNRGSVRVVGDGCHLKIAHNVGDIEYTGDGGKVQLGPKSSKNNIKYIGDGGKVTFAKDNQLKISPKSTRRSGDMKSSNNSSKSQEEDLSSSPEVQNLLNERKEAEQRYRNKNCEAGRTKNDSKNSTIKTKIITTLDCEGRQIVKKWFISPNSVIKSFDGSKHAKNPISSLNETKKWN